MAERENYWYSIISYIPSSIRYERINIGAILGNKLNTTYRFKVLPETSKKIKNFLWDSIELKEYSVAIELLNFLINRNFSELTTPSINSSTNLSSWLNAKIPSGVVFSKVHFARTDNPNFIFDHLLEKYVDNQFFKENINNSIVSVKQDVKKYFESKKLLDRKLKTKVTVRPSKKLPLAIKMDYMYLNQLDNQVGLVQIPSIENIIAWYERMYTFLSKADSDNFHLNIILGENDYNNDSQQVQPFVDEFNKSQNVTKILVPENNNTPLKNLAKDIENSMDADEWKASEFLEDIA